MIVGISNFYHGKNDGNKTLRLVLRITLLEQTNTERCTGYVPCNCKNSCFFYVTYVTSID